MFRLFLEHLNFCSTRRSAVRILASTLLASSAEQSEQTGFAVHLVIFTNVVQVGLAGLAVEGPVLFFGIKYFAVQVASALTMIT